MPKALLSKIRSQSIWILSLVLTASALILPAQKARAYGYETHFHETQMMLVMAGIHPSIAERLAAYAQWVDTSKINSAMNPIIGMHGRVSRLLHFPTEGASTVEALFNIVAGKLKLEAAAHGDVRNFLNVATRDSMIANEIFSQALKTGNPYLMGASLHVLMDSYAHEGFNYIIGHGARGHYPDRPWMFIEKHNEMRRKLFHAMTRIRQVLPAKALSDLALNDLGKLNRDMNGQELFETYVSNPIIQDIDKSVPHNHPLYTGEAVRLIIEKMEASGVAKPELRMYVFDHLRPLFFETKDNGERRNGWEIMSEIVHHIYALEPDQRNILIDNKKVIEKYGNVPVETIYKGKNGQQVTVTKADMMVNTNKQAVLNNMVLELSAQVIPRPALGDADNEPGSKQTFETEYLYSDTEKRIQVSKWQSARKAMFGLAPVELDQATTVTKIFMFLAKDSGNLMADLDKMEKNIRLVKVTNRERMKFMFQLFKYTMLDYATFRVTNLLTKLKLMEKPVGNLRITDANVMDAKYWQIDEVFERLKNAGIFKNIYSDAQVNYLIKRWEKQNSRFAKRMEKLQIENLTPEEKLDRRTEAFYQRQSPFVPGAIPGETPKVRSGIMCRQAHL